MFYEENYTYERIDKLDYEKLIDLYEGESEIKGTIYSFYEDAEKKVHKLTDLETPNEKWNLLCKYYVVSMDLDCEIPLIIRKLLYIVNLGYFIVTGPYYFDTVEYKTIFDNYDNEFKNMNLEIDNNKFLNENNHFNQVKIYRNGEILNYNDELFEKYLEEQQEYISIIDFEYLLIYAYKGKALRFYASQYLDDLIENRNDYNKEINDILTEHESNAGVIYKKNKDRFDLVFRIGY